MSKIKSLIKHLNETSEKLSKENKKLFDDIVIYVRTSNLKERDAEEFLQQILDSFLNAENRNVSIEEMLGTSDIKGYCKEIVKVYKSSYNFISRSGEYIMYLGIIILISSLLNFIFQNLNSLIETDISTFSLSLNVTLEVLLELPLMGFLIIAFMAYVRDSCFKKRTKSGSIKEFFILWILCIIPLSIIVIFEVFLDNILLFNINIIVILIIGIPLYFIGQYLTEK